MKTIHGSPLLRLLRCKRLLRKRLRWLGIDDERTVKWLVALDNGRAVAAARAPSSAVLATLRRRGLIRCDGTLPTRPAALERHGKPSLAFVQAVNLELTYDCNWDCGHCLQQGIRKRRTGLWMSTEVGKQAVEDAWFAGLASIAVNFTGGETFQPQSNPPELVEAARSLKVDVRINTNGWWGNEESIRLGKLTFRSSRQVVGWLRETGVAILALSFDNRYRDHPERWPPVVSIMRECERQRQLYQIVCTGIGWDGASLLCEELERTTGVPPSHLVPMEMIDIGGASGRSDATLQPASIVDAVRRSPCGGKGFFRPRILHIAPDGGVRTCMYAPGGGWMGNVHRESLLDIVNRFAESPVATAVSSGEVASVAEAVIQPYAHVYRSVTHPCAALAVFARAMEAATASDAPACGIHERIASELNLRARDATRKCAVKDPSSAG